MPLGPSDAAAIATWLLSHREDETEVDHPAELPPVETPDDMYGVLEQMTKVRSTLGTQCGWKVGCTSAELRRSLGLTEPVSAPLFSKTFMPTGASVGSTTAGEVMLLEAEFLFAMARPLPPKQAGTQYSADEAWSAVGELALAVEVCGSRFGGRARAAASPMQLIADGGLNVASVVGPAMPAAKCRRDLAGVAVKFLVNGVPRGDPGSGASVLGHPAEALAWLANHLNARGFSSADQGYGGAGVPGLVAGDLVMSGAAAVLGAEMFGRGDTLTAEFAGMGSVSFQVGSLSQKL